MSSYRDGEVALNLQQTGIDFLKKECGTADGAVEREELDEMGNNPPCTYVGTSESGSPAGKLHSCALADALGMVRDWAVRGDADNVWLMEMSGVTSTNLKDLGKVITEREELRDGLGAKEEKRGGEWVSASVPPPLPPTANLEEKRAGQHALFEARVQEVVVQPQNVVNGCHLGKGAEVNHLVRG